MIALDTLTKIEAVLAGAVAANQPVVHFTYQDWNTNNELTAPATFRTALNSTTDVTILAAPTISPRRKPLSMSLYNKDTASITVTIKTDDGTTEYIILKITLLTLETLHWNEAAGFYALDVNGNRKEVTSSVFSSITLGGGSALANYTTWANYTPTVTLVGGAGNTVPVYTTNTGRWLRIGSIVHVDVYLTGDGGAEGAGSGVVNIALPVVSGASFPAGYFWCGVAANPTSEYQLIGSIGASASTINLNTWGANPTTQANFTGAEQSDTGRSIRLHFSYEV